MYVCACVIFFLYVMLRRSNEVCVSVCVSVFLFS